MRLRGCLLLALAAFTAVQTGTRGGTVQAAIDERRDVSQEAVNRALQADINRSVGVVARPIVASLLPAGSRAFNRLDIATIIPGRALGPVALGMSAAKARASAARFERATGCGIDVLVRGGVVVAAGSARAGCLDLQLPGDNQSFLPREAVGGQAVVELSGSPDALVNAFGTPLVVRQGADELALIFANGLVARVEGVHANGGFVRYLAVQAAASTSVPPIGYLASVPASAAMTPIRVITMAIVPGSSLGPVALGMLGGLARRAAIRFEHETGCEIDLLMARGVVVAAGSAWGACLYLQLPSGTPPMLMSDGMRDLPVVVGVGGPAAALIDVFGTPSVVRQGTDEAALIFPNGLAARVGSVHADGGIVTYLAVQAAGATAAPRIGYFNLSEQAQH